MPVVVLPLGQDEVPGLVSDDGRPLGPGGAVVQVNNTLASHQGQGAAGQESQEEYRRHYRWCLLTTDYIEECIFKIRNKICKNAQYGVRTMNN